MSQLDDLFFLIRQHPAYEELLKGPGAPEVKEFRPGVDVLTFAAESAYRSGRRQQDNAWRQFLIGQPTSDKEKS